MRKAVSVLLWFVYGTGYAVLFLPGLLCTLLVWPFDPHRKMMNVWFMWAGGSLVYLNPFWKLRHVGLDRVDLNRPLIFVANHQSFLDMPLMATVPWNMKWISKEGLFRIPVVGWMMRLAGHVGIKRGTTGAARALDTFKPYLNASVPVMIFPEGTRSVDGTLKPFKNGAFVLAKDTGAAIQPLVIRGTNRALTPGTWVFHLRGALSVEALAPIEPQAYPDVESLKGAVHAAMKAALEG